ncbi:patatin-like phospholipase family protein, partial [Acinetobacter baumannii]
SAPFSFSMAIEIILHQRREAKMMYDTTPDKLATTLPRSPKSVIAAKPVNLALQGGGSHGAFTWGVLDALLESGEIDFTSVSGTSAGAMNAV